MSIVYLATDPRSLADRLAADLDEHAKQGDFFTPSLVVVPNRYMRKWLRLWLARRLDVAINIRFELLEDALWLLLGETDPGDSQAEVIDENIYRLMVLSILLEEDDPHLAPLRRYIQMDGASLTRLTCRRAWYLADRLGLLVRDYEYHRQDALIQRWLRSEFGLGSAGEFHKMMERAQRALFLHITRESDGKRALLSRLSKQPFKTFPQYAMERITTASTKRTTRMVSFFGFTHLCELHARTIGWLGQCFDIRLHHVNVLSSRLSKTLSADALREFARSMQANDDLAASWGRAGSESLAVLASVLQVPFDVELVPAAEAEPSARRGKSPRPSRSRSVLARLQDQLLANVPTRDRVEQDVSLQIIACPGAAREVETVYNSILHNLQSDASLRQTDIAVLVADMPKYRALLQAGFDRLPKQVEYNMVDFSAAGTSVFGQALLGMLDLALESFSRSRVFQVILNPCFLARLGASRAQAMTWLEWADRLGIHQGWDADEKHEQGYARSPFYAWRLGLQRLRLGRFMDVVAEDASAPAPRFGHVIPFADLASSDREQLDAFCRAVEGLLPTLACLRSPMTGQRWANALQRLVQEFLDVPADQPEEAQVRGELLAAFEKLAAWDAMHATKSAALPLALVREYVLSQLEVLEGNRGEYLVGGVTIAALQPMRAVPFQIVYVIGLGEDLFPGSNALSSFDLRGVQRLPGDIRPAEQRLYDFFATLLAARRKLYLLYNSHDLQKDQPLLPSVPLLQLRRHLSRHVLKSEFEMVAIPTQVDDSRYLDAAQQPTHQDVLVQYRDADRSLAILAAEREHRLALDLSQQAEWTTKRGELAIDFSVPPLASVAVQPRRAVTLRELGRFLQLPADASLRRHLGVDEQDEATALDEEPLVTPRSAGFALVRQALEQLVLAAAAGDVKDALGNWPQRFAALHAEWRLRSRVPEEAFGEIDRASLQGELTERIHGTGGIEAFLHERAGMTFCGPVLIGESTMPIGARLRFPALRVRVGENDIRIVGWTSFAWQSARRIEVLIATNFPKVEGAQIAKPLFEPALLYLAMLASTEPGSDGSSAASWLVQREFVVHVSHCAGVQTWTYPAGCITPAEATQYLTDLTRDLLDPAQFDLLPFDVLCKNKELQRAFDSAIVAQIAPEFYRQVLEDAIAEERENTFYGFEFPLLVEMIGAQVPADALAKVQRRFQLLDRGPARLRQQPKAPHKKKAAKP